MTNRFVLVLGTLLLGMLLHARAADAAADAAPETAARLEVLEAARAGWPALFDAAYARYPELPRGLLESIAWVQSRWVLLDGGSFDGGSAERESPPAFGPMGLYGGDGFQDQLGDAAALLGVPRWQVAGEVRWNILGAAALLADLGRRLPPDASEAQWLAAYAGFPAGDEVALRFARECFAYDVLLAIDRGVDDDGVRIVPRAVEWERQFDADALVRQRAPFVRLDPARGTIEAGGYVIDPVDERLHAPSRAVEPVPASSDYAPALWVASPYYHSRGTSASAVAIHTMQGSYPGTIAWFQDNPSSVSAHYLVRSADGQLTQMVRDAQAAHHVGSQNSYTLGIEHEGYVDNPAWYSTAMYNASAALTRNFCSRYAIACASAWNGAASAGVTLLPSSVRIKGHQHYPDTTHTDPGRYWDWPRYYALLNPGGGGGSGTSSTLDGFETGEGHFATAPAYSGSTTGISTASTAERDCSMASIGHCAEHLRLVDDPASSQAWSVRFLSGSGTPSANVAIARNGRVGFWIHVAGSGFSAGIGIDDSDGTERSTMRTVPANTWTWLEWNLADAAQWNPWVGGNGAIGASRVTVDAIWLQHAPTTWTVNLHLDEVSWRAN
jgi:hypothetical protein